jgi:hypothetical protein
MKWVWRAILVAIGFAIGFALFVIAANYGIDIPY